MRSAALRALMVGLMICGNCGPLLLLWLVWPRAQATEALVAIDAHPLIVDGALALLFPLQHSVWTQRPVKRALLRLLGEHFERPMYVIGSALALVATGLLWQPVDVQLWRPGEVGLWALRGLLILTLLTQAWSAEVVGGAHLQGLTHVRSALAGVPVPPPAFQVRGLYKYMRHPIASSQVVMVWSVGTLRPDLLLLASAWTVWIVGATALEERRLLQDIGAPYADYRRTTGFLIPRLRR